MRSLFLAAALLLGAAAAHAETFQFADREGTVHYTNAPTDPRYRKMAKLSGTQEGWLKVPAVTLALPSFSDMITVASNRHGLPEELVKAVIRVESGFNPRAVSNKGAQGLMQLMPKTASILGVRDSFDPAENIDGGVRHLKALLERFNNNLPLALAAYNAGAGAVDQYRGIPPYAETRAYVSRIIGILGGDTIASAVIPSSTYRYVASDGAVVYTNIPPRGVLKKP